MKKKRPISKKQNLDYHNHHCVNNTSVFNQWLQNHQVLIESILTFATIIVAIFLFFITRKQVDISKETMDHTITQSEKSIKLSQKIAETQERFAKIDARAYVVVDSFTQPIIKPGEKFHIEFSCFNIGNTPANHIRIAVKPKFGGTGMYEPEIRKFEKEKLTDFTKCSPLGPGQNITNQFNSESIITPIQYNAICINKQPIFIIGMVTYTDMFKGRDTTRFCLKYNFPDKYLIWTNYNEVK